MVLPGLQIQIKHLVPTIEINGLN